MEGTWERLRPLVESCPDGPISRTKIFKLGWEDQIKLCYDPATPSTVMGVLLYSKDQAVVLATKHRPYVLSGALRNPFLLTEAL